MTKILLAFACFSRNALFWLKLHYLFQLSERKTSHQLAPHHIIVWVWLSVQLGAFKTPTLPETNSLPLKIAHSKRTFIFQPSIFRCKLAVSFREGNSNLKFETNWSTKTSQPGSHPSLDRPQANVSNAYDSHLSSRNVAAWNKPWILVKENGKVIKQDLEHTFEIYSYTLSKV